MSDRNHIITGVVVSTATDTGIPGLRVDASDKDLLNRTIVIQPKTRYPA